MASPTMLRCRAAALATLLSATALPLWGEPAGRWPAHAMNRPRPAVVRPAPAQLPVAAPEDAIILFDGENLDAWRSADGERPRWIVRDGAMISVPESGYLYTARPFGDVQLHVEWAAPVPAQGVGQGRGNSGVFLMSKYEVQVLDSYENDTYPDGQAASIYGQYPPLVNACRPPGEWQSFDIVFRRPRFHRDGRLESPARVTVLHNGILVHDDVEIWGPTSWLQHQPYALHPAKLPLALQDHGNPVRYRNIWARELAEWDASGPPPAPQEPAIHLPPDVLAGYAGTYQTPGGGEYQLRVEEGVLKASFYGPQTIELVPYSAKKFGMRWTDATLIFELDEQSQPQGFEFNIGRSSRTAKKVQGQPASPVSPEDQG